MFRHLLSALVLLTVLSGCAGFQAIEPGKAVTIDKRLSIDPQVKWAKVVYPGRSAALWTIDGFGLDELHFFTNVKSGAPLLKLSGQSKEAAPKYDKSMLPNDVMELLASTLGRLGYTQMRTSGLAPMTLGGAEAFTFDLAFTNAAGLELKGRALMAQRGDTLDAIVFIAPGEYYFPRYAPVVDRAFTSVQLLSN